MLFRQAHIVILLKIAAVSAATSNTSSTATTSADTNIIDKQSHGDFMNDIRRLQRKTKDVVSIDSQQPSFLQHRNLDQEGGVSETCELKFLGCLTHLKCVSCFQEMGDESIDWSLVAPDTTCMDLLDSVADKFNKCTDLKGNTEEKKTFCDTFDACSLFIDESDDNWIERDDDASLNDDATEINCDQLTSCDFEGFKPNYIGDGICHEHVGGCYNHKICNYDGGDCCEDTCKSKHEYAECGTDGYVCRDPKSSKCETSECQSDGKDSSKKDNGGSDKPKVECEDNETAYQLLQFDSFGDGWEISTEMTITEKGNSFKKIYKGALETGYEGKAYICLSNEPKCYNAILDGGSWGNDISWQIKPMSAGSREIASGGSPMDCDFPVAGATCDNTCIGGTANVDRKKDDKFEKYSDLSKCMEDKCVVQVSKCKSDNACSPCMADSPPAYCLANANYKALVFCSQCNCVSGSDQDFRKDFCAGKSKEKSKEEDKEDDNTSKVTQCDWEQRKQGMDALQKYSKCARIEDKSMLTLFEFDNENFGLLDKFEKCASEYLDNKTTKSALKCMEILQDAIDNPAGAVDKKTHTNADGKEIPLDAISSLARDLLHRGHDFCDCSSESMKACPACYDFMRFKTLLYESIDACNALDNIDCGAWQEFARPCKANMLEKFGSINFHKTPQCTYIHDEKCGNVGSFPGLRELDCSNQITEEAWDFYLDYRHKCMGDAKPSVPSDAKPSPPKPTPNSPPVYDADDGADDDDADDFSESGSTSYIPGDSSNNFSNNSNPKKYVPPEEEGKRHHLRNFIMVCVVGGVGYFVYKKRTSFDYSSFRMSRARNFTPYGDDSSMYDSLPMMEQHSGGMSSFQPPTLPPHPNAYGMPHSGMPHNGGVA